MGDRLVEAEVVETTKGFDDVGNCARSGTWNGKLSRSLSKITQLLAFTSSVSQAYGTSETTDILTGPLRSLIDGMIDS